MVLSESDYEYEQSLMIKGYSVKRYYVKNRLLLQTARVIEFLKRIKKVDR